MDLFYFFALLGNSLIITLPRNGSITFSLFSLVHFAITFPSLSLESEKVKKVIACKVIPGKVMAKCVVDEKHIVKQCKAIETMSMQ